MKAHIVQIGNSRGIRIPKALLEQCHLKKEVELEPRDHALLIRSATKTRKNWDEAFARMAKNEDDLLANLSTTEWDKTEWLW